MPFWSGNRLPAIGCCGKLGRRVPAILGFPRRGCIGPGFSFRFAPTPLHLAVPHRPAVSIGMSCRIRAKTRGDRRTGVARLWYVRYLMELAAPSWVVIYLPDFCWSSRRTGMVAVFVRFIKDAFIHLSARVAIRGSKPDIPWESNPCTDNQVSKVQSTYPRYQANYGPPTERALL